MNLLWLQSGGCGGCTMSLLCSGARDLPGLLEGAGIHIAWHPSLSEATGEEVRALLAEFESGARPLDLLCVEGAILRGPEGSGRFHILAGTGTPMLDWARRLAAQAGTVLAIGMNSRNATPMTMVPSPNLTGLDGCRLPSLVQMAA